MSKRDWNNWKDCHNGLYSVSECGEVRNSRTGRILKKCIAKGYEVITISERGGYTTARVHSLVAKAFLGPRPDGYHVNHKDGNKRNNHISNLEYCTAKQNREHAIKTGLVKPKESNRKLSNKQIAAIKKIYGTGFFSYREIAEKFNISYSAVQYICGGRRWQEIG